MESAAPSLAPCVSIVIATYNRSNVLALTLRTVLWQTFTDWEVLVVGDACTDDTAAVVAALADPRIRFVNLPENCGEQSGPNNYGAQHTAGKFLAWLNHDDFWLPDHLERALAELEATGADLVFTLCERITAESTGTIFNAAPGGAYEPSFFIPASCWLLRRELLAELGPWRAGREMFLIPSQDWIFRAWRRQKSLRLCPHLTVVAIASDKTAGSYAERQIDEHAALFGRLAANPDAFRVAELTRQLTAPNAETLKAQPWAAVWREIPKRALRRFWLLLGIHPGTIRYALRTRKKGGGIDELRRRRGLPVKSD
jgi:glycosyltransferase involved in cell wall biosynthesis